MEMLGYMLYVWGTDIRVCLFGGREIDIDGKIWAENESW